MIEHSHATEVWTIRRAVFGPANICGDCDGDGYQLVKIFHTKKTPRNGLVDFNRKTCPMCEGTGKPRRLRG